MVKRGSGSSIWIIMKINPSVNQLRLIVDLIYKGWEQGKTLYNPLVEAICNYQKEIIAKRMIFCVREEFSRQAYQFISDITLTQYYVKEARIFRTAMDCTVPFINTGAFHILLQYSILHRGLTTGFEEIYRGLLFRTETIRNESINKNIPALKFKLGMELPDTFYTQHLVPWWPDWYPRTFFIDEHGNKRQPVSDMEKQIFLGLNNPILECSPCLSRAVFSWSWSECITAIELISSTQAIARLAYTFPGWVIEQSDEVMAKHLYRLRVEQRNIYNHAMRSYHRSIYKNMPYFCNLTHSFIYRISTVRRDN